MARVENGRFTAKMDGLFVVFLIGMWLPLHKDLAAVGHGVIRARSAVASHNAPTV